MRGWLLSITALSLLFVLAELFLSEGEIKKYIGGILRAVFVITAFFGLIKILPFNIGSAVNTATQNEYGSVSSTTTIEGIGVLRDNLAERNIEKDIEKTGIQNAKVNIHSYYNGEKRVVSLVSVDLSESGISENDLNIIAIEEIKKAVKNHIDVEEELISVYGWN